MFKKGINKMSIKILQLWFVLVLTYKKFVKTVEAVTNKILVKTNTLAVSLCSDLNNKHKETNLLI